MLGTLEVEQTDIARLKEIAERAGKPVEQVLHDILVNVDSSNEDQNKNSQTSKWAKVAQEVQADPPLSGLSKEVMESVKEFRENFNFKHDLTDHES